MSDATTRSEDATEAEKIRPARTGDAERCRAIAAALPQYFSDDVPEQISRDINRYVASFTAALYDARELAMSRMQAEAEALRAEGVVGVTLASLSHRWDEHTTEFFALGTAVRATRNDHTISTPAMVVPLT